MTTTVFLVRHAAHALLDRILVGRMPGVALDETGRAQAARLAGQMARDGITLLQSSPRERARETAAFIAARAGISFTVEDAADELDCGVWTGRPFSALSCDPAWIRWNSARATARPPGGESMQELQSRIVGHLESLHATHRGARAAIVTHAEVIRAAILHYAQLPIDMYAEIEIPPASVSVLLLAESGSRLMSLNQGRAA